MLRYLCIALSILFASAATANPYLRGYAQGVVNALAPAKAIRVTAIDQGVAVLKSDHCLVDALREALTKALTDTAAITAVEWRAEPCMISRTVRDDPSILMTDDIGWLPKGELFPQLLGDSREPHFAAHYQAHEAPRGNFNATLVALGDYFPFVRGNSEVGRVEFGITGGIFSLFNLDSNSFALINSDFILGFPLSYRLGSFSARAQVYHQSSHLGDELLLGAPNIDRVNLSFEDAELLFAYEMLGFRLYGGGGYLIRSEPDLNPARWQSGLEFRWPAPFGGFELIAAADVQAFEEQDWDVNHSYQLGLAWCGDTGRELRLMLERYDGFSPNGQFFNIPVEFWGVGVFFEP